MRTIFRRDVKILIVDAEAVEKDLKLFARDHTARACVIQTDTLRRIAEHLKRLKTDMDTILSDCAFPWRQYRRKQNLKFVNRIYHSCDILYKLSDDIKRINTRLNNLFISRFELLNFFKDWDRFEKTISQVQKSVNFLPQRRKNNAWANRRRL